VAGSCEFGDEPSGSGATRLVSRSITHSDISGSHDGENENSLMG
jgi:hypothetical protein